MLKYKILGAAFLFNALALSANMPIATNYYSYDDYVFRGCGPGCCQTCVNYGENTRTERTSNGQSNQNDDSTIQSDVRDAIKNDRALNGRNVQVSVDNGVVTLKGNVNSASEKSKAESDATNVDGVQKVINKLNVNQQ